MTAASRAIPPRSVLFVCTGNTCRSPLAAALLKVLVAKRLGVAVAELEASGFRVASAGVMAYAGDAPSEPACAAAAEYDADLTTHRSRMVNPELLANATDVIAMTAGHAAALQFRYPGIGPTPRLLCGPGEDLPDPFGSDLDIYRECAAVIAQRLESFITEWFGS
jgi:protein-tyrosine-phosphatase